MRGVPIDLLLVQAERLVIVAHRAHDQGEIVGGGDVHFGEGHALARPIRLRQRRNREILPVQAMFEQPSGDE